MLIPMNYFLVILFMPPAVIFYESRVEGKYCQCLKRKKKQPEVIIGVEEDEEQDGKAEKFFGGKWNDFV